MLLYAFRILQPCFIYPTVFFPVADFHASPFRLPVPGIRTPELVLIHGILAIRGAGTEREVFQYLIVEVDITIELTIPIVDIDLIDCYQRAHYVHVTVIHDICQSRIKQERRNLQGIENDSRL